MSDYVSRALYTASLDRSSRLQKQLKAAEKRADELAEMPIRLAAVVEENERLRARIVECAGDSGEAQHVREEQQEEGAKSPAVPGSIPGPVPAPCPLCGESDQ